MPCEDGHCWSRIRAPYLVSGRIFNKPNQHYNLWIYLHRSRNSVVVFFARKSCVRCAELWSECHRCKDLNEYFFWTCWFIIVITPESDAILKNEGDLIAHSFWWEFNRWPQPSERHWLTTDNYWLVQMNNYFLILASEAT